MSDKPVNMLLVNRRILRVSAENAEFQIIQALKTNRAKRHKTHEVFIEGTECIRQALGAGLEFTRIIMGAHEECLSDWAHALIQAQGAATLIEMSPSLYASLCDRMNPSELLVTAKIKPETENPVLLPPAPCILVFDRPSDFGNLGSIIRSANAFGIDALFTVGHGSDVYEPKVIRASLGSVFYTQIRHIESMESLERFIREQKQRCGLSVLGTDSVGSVSLRDKDLHAPIMLIIGNEAKGMSVALRSLCDEIVRIPIMGAVNSLNVACAVSILLWELYRKR
jgi:TrmH family RNA methyltransferase